MKDRQQLQDEYNAYLTRMVEGLDQLYWRERMRIQVPNQLHWLVRAALVLAYLLCLLGVVGCNEEAPVPRALAESETATVANTDPLGSNTFSVPQRYPVDGRCYVFSDGLYQCWLPRGVCEFRMPVDLPSGGKVASTMECGGYAELVPVE